MKPDVIKIIEFNKGISNGLKNLIIEGGQEKLISIEGEIELWKKVQKNEIKKNNSEIMNIIILNFIIEITDNECIPWNVLSRIISRNHIRDTKINIIKLIIINIKLFK